MNGNGRFCTRCKQVGHLEQSCKNKNNAHVSTIKFDSCYMLSKGTNGVKAKFISAPIVGPKKKAIWVPKSLVTNLGGHKKVWVPKNELIFSCRSIIEPEGGIGCLIVGSLNI